VPLTVAHSLLAAHADRVTELARLYTLLERAVIAGGPEGPDARGAHRALSARIVEWHGIDIEAERRDVVTIPAGEREEMLATVRRATAHGPQRNQVAVPTSMPRAALVRFRRSAARFEAFERLKGPAIIIGNEARLMLEALESGSAPIPPPDPGFDPGDDFGATFSWGLAACLICEPGASGGVDLGLGTSPAVAALLGLTRYPFVPRGRFCGISPTGPLRGDLESTGPIGWAAEGDVATLARDLAAAANEQPAYAVDLRAASARVEAAARRGHAVIGFVEHLPPEAEGDRCFLVEPP
jgi:hypothetical protein